MDATRGPSRAEWGSISSCPRSLTHSSVFPKYSVESIDLTTERRRASRLNWEVSEPRKDPLFIHVFCRNEDVFLVWSATLHWWSRELSLGEFVSGGSSVGIQLSFASPAAGKSWRFAGFLRGGVFLVRQTEFYTPLHRLPLLLSPLTLQPRLDLGRKST